MPSFAQLVPPGLCVVQAVDVGDEGHLGDETWSQTSQLNPPWWFSFNLPGWISLVATMESFLPWKTTVQLRITTDYNNLYFRNVRFILGRTRVIEKAGHQVYSGTKMFWCWSPREENEGFSKYINFCWNIFLLANFRHWVIFIATICHNHKHYLAFLFGSTLLGFNTNISADSPLP